ncbi:MAG: iron ABC transporter ATP-binding protein [Dethiosulfovibrio peptidovorans]|nr:MAG: iron ABC transporter ATP-binding protein [Dethiosulfovibrio peptidovorans]
MTFSVRGLGFRWGKKWVFREVSFSVDPGEILAVMGPNGVGKTTLLRCLNGILVPHEGAVWVDGGRVGAMSRDQVARSMGYVPQYTVPQRMTVFDAVLLGRRPHMRFTVTDRDLVMVESVLDLLDLGGLRLRTLDRMSGGERQKVAVARALVQDPSVLLLDEPTASLDMKNRVELMEVLRRTVQEHGLAAVTTIHDVNGALRYADRCLFLRDGSVEAWCRPAEVTETVIQRVYGLAVELVNHRGIPLVVPKGEP